MASSAQLAMANPEIPMVAASRIEIKVDVFI